MWAVPTITFTPAPEVATRRTVARCSTNSYRPPSATATLSGSATLTAAQRPAAAAVRDRDLGGEHLPVVYRRALRAAPPGTGTGDRYGTGDAGAEATTSGQQQAVRQRLDLTHRGAGATGCTQPRIASGRLNVAAQAVNPAGDSSSAEARSRSAGSGNRGGN